MIGHITFYYYYYDVYPYSYNYLLLSRGRLSSPFNIDLARVVLFTYDITIRVINSINNNRSLFSGEKTLFYQVCRTCKTLYMYTPCCIFLHCYVITTIPSCPEKTEIRIATRNFTFFFFFLTILLLRTRYWIVVLNVYFKTNAARDRRHQLNND